MTRAPARRYSFDSATSINLTPHVYKHVSVNFFSSISILYYQLWDPQSHIISHYYSTVNITVSYQLFEKKWKHKWKVFLIITLNNKRLSRAKAVSASFHKTWRKVRDMENCLPTPVRCPELNQPDFQTLLISPAPQSQALWVLLQKASLIPVICPIWSYSRRYFKREKQLF